jgi:restriction endonuclease S subunit
MTKQVKYDKLPPLSFSGFTDPWEQRKLGDIVDWSKGKNLAKAVLNERGIGDDVIHYADLYKFLPVVHDVIHWSESGEGTIIPDNSILFPMSDVTPVGLARTTTITKTGVKAGGDTIIGEVSNKNSAEFVSYYINAHSLRILPLVTGTTVRHISASALATLDIYLPSKAEQAKISAFLNSLSDLITLHQRKLGKLKNLKTALLEKMFPKNGSNIPEMRFGGFTDPWEQRKLGDIVDWSKGKNLAKAVLNERGIGDDVIHYADLYKFLPVVHDVIHWSESGEGTIIPDNSILFPMSDVTPVGLARTTTITKTGVKAGGDTIIGEVSNKNSAEFVSYYINAHSLRILPLVTGTTVRHISASALATLDIYLPSKAEQAKISAFLNSLSDLITLHQHKLGKLKNIKKSFLEKMFV